MKVSHNTLPEAIQELLNEVQEVKQLLLEKTSDKLPPEKEDQLLTVPQAAAFLSLSVPTVYGLIHRKELPSMRRSKRVYFSKLDLINYLKAGKRKTAEELDHDAEEFLKRKNKNNSREGNT